MISLMRVRRVQMGMSQSKLSLAAGVEYWRVARMEKYLCAPYPEEAKSIAKVLGIKEGDLQKETLPAQPCETTKKPGKE
jgi:ribosome-binding protein aMBF1 (putative translation factor)